MSILNQLKTRMKRTIMKTRNNCPDCGTAPGQPHKNECDVERCSVCGQQRITCNCKDHDPLKSIWSGEWPTTKAMPKFLGVPILARHDPKGPYSKENCYFRTAVSEEEALAGVEIHVALDLRKRLFELERQGWVQFDEEKRRKLMEL